VFGGAGEDVGGCVRVVGEEGGVGGGEGDEEGVAGEVGGEAVEGGGRGAGRAGADAAPKQPDPVWATWGRDFPDLRSIVMHVVTETAIHAGHLDVVRELIDGRQWVVL
jgi:hypothetical protein